MTPPSEKKLFLLDAFALIYRSYFAFSKNPRINSQGQNTSAAFGFTNTLIEVLRKEQPTHIAVVFDAPGPTNRTEDFTGYKANRQEMPEDIRWAIPHIKRIVEAFNIPLYLLEGYEADDIVGTMAKEAEKAGFTTYMMTPDKDYAQLVDENTFMYRPGRGGKPAEIWGIPEVKEKFEVERCEQVIDILGLWGDAVDNIPGIPGIGEKTSKKLIAKYGSVEGLIAHADELKGKQKENVINFAEQGLMSKMLATIILDVPIDYSFEDMKIHEVNKPELEKIFSELEFRNLGKRFLGVEISTPQATVGQMDMFAAAPAEEVVAKTTTLEDVKHNYKLVQTNEEITALLEELKAAEAVCFDTETTGLNPFEAELVGFSFAVKPHEAYWVPCSENKEEAQVLVDQFKPIFEDETKLIIAQNLKYDLNVLKKYNVVFKAKEFDTMIAHYLINPDMKHNMDILADTYLNYKPISIETLIGKKGKNQKSMRDLEAQEITDYASEDADITYQLYQKFVKEVEQKPLDTIFNDIEMPLVQVLADMEEEGIKIDVDALNQFSVELGKELDQLQASIYKHAEEEFNIDSPRQLGVILFDKLQITDKAKKTKTGQYQTNEDTLLKLKGKHDIIEDILNYRSIKKLKSTYVDTLPQMVNPATGRIHTSYMQTVAATGRLSSNNPNLQNIPIRSEKGKEIRKAFIPRSEEFTLMAADYSQIELRIIAALSEDKNMIQAFVDGKDIHAATAAKVYDVALEEVTRDQRSHAKAVNFGIIYGQSAFGLSQKLNIKRKEAKEIIDSYYNQYSSIKTYMTQCVEQAKELGYAETIMGRRRYLKDINSANAVVRGFAERNAVNAPIQGSAADIIKIAMINIHKAMKEQNLKSKMLLQVHDELVFDVHLSELDLMKELVKDKMEHAVKLSVPLEVEAQTADNWLEAH